MSRLKEPSTWAGIGLILTAITPVLPLAYATPVGALVGVCGGIASILAKDYATGAAQIITGILGIFTPEAMSK